MSEYNPYAAPPPVLENVIVAQQAALFDGSQGLWRHGAKLVVRHGTPLPPRCVKTNQPTKSSLKRNLTWYSKWLWLLLFFSLPVCLIVIVIVQKKATVHIGLTPEWMTRRRWRMAITWGVALLSLSLLVAGLMLVGNPDQNLQSAGAICMMAFPFALIGSLLYGHFALRMVHASLIDDHFAWIQGVCPDYLADLPAWPGKPG